MGNIERSGRDPEPLVIDGRCEPGTCWAEPLGEACDHWRRECEAARQQLRGAVERIAEADRLLRAAYADTHPEDVPVEVLGWLNPDALGGQ